MPPQRPGSLRAYLGTIIRNLSISRYRASRAQKRFGGGGGLSELSDCVPAPENIQRTGGGPGSWGELISRWLDGLGGGGPGAVPPAGIGTGTP